MSVPAEFARWLLGDVIAPDAYSRAAGRLTKQSQRRKLYGAVKRSSGLRPGWAYRRWLKSDETRQLLRQCTEEAYDSLVASLSAELGDRSGDAEPLVNATLGAFLASLEASDAVSVVDERAAQRFEWADSQSQAILDTVTADQSFTENLERLPVAVQRPLSSEPVPAAAKQLAAALACETPSAAIIPLAGDPQPQWLAEAPGSVQLALANAATIYGSSDAASRAFEWAAEWAADPAMSFARAAGAAHDAGDQDRAEMLLARARAAGGGPAVEVLAAAMADDWEGVLAAVTREQALAESRITKLYGTAVYEVHGASEAAKFLDEAVERYPKSPVLMLACATRLWERSLAPTCATGELDRAKARSLALTARDVLRLWRADSREAAGLACTLTLIASDMAGALRIGSAPPHGEALPAEAEFEPIRKIVADLALTSGDIERAREIAASSEGFVRAFIEARLLASGGGSTDQVQEAFDTAFAEARSEEDRRAAWLAAADAAVETLPGEADLREFPEFDVFVRARRLVALGRGSEAIPSLRAQPDDELCRQLLAAIYVEQGHVQESVDELLAAATRFCEPAFNMQAIRVLADASRWEDAQRLADDVRADVVGREARDFLHDVGTVAAANQGDWADVERRARVWIGECGWSDHRTWLLVRSLIEQVRLADAWDAFCEANDPTIRDEVDAQAWIILHARFQRSRSTRRQILDLCDQFGDDPHVVVAATNASVVMGDVATEDAEDESDGARWRRLWALRETFEGVEESFEAINIPDDREEIIEVFRKRMAQRAELLDEWTTKVRLERWPYGMLSFAAGRSYTQVLAQRAVGCLPITIPDPEFHLHELSVAAAALGEAVIVDVSALTTSFYIPERWAQLRTSFRRVEITSGSLFDVNRAVADLAPMPGKAGMIVWDVEAGVPVFVDADPEAEEQVRQHVAWVRDAASGLTARPISGDKVDRESPWQETVQAALDLGLPLWADDLGLRLFAAEQGVPTFGTYALLHALEVQGVVSTVAVSTAISTLRDEYCVDLPLDADWLIGSARSSDWGPGPAMVAFGRPATWDDREAAYEIWRALAESAAQEDTSLVASWSYAATRGLAARLKGAPAAQVTAVLAAVLAASAGLVDYQPADFRSCAEAVARAAQSEGADDPTERALFMLLEAMTTLVGAAAAGPQVARLGSELVGEQHDAYVRVILPTS